MLEYDRTFNQGEFMCDKCGRIQTIEGDFMEIIEEIKDYDWTSKYINGDWKHYCCDCSN
jgi:hypothetical protein